MALNLAPLATSHTVTVLSPTPDANCRPSGLQATLKISACSIPTPKNVLLGCPIRLTRACPFVPSHILTDPSRDPEANQWLSGLQATHQTWSACPFSIRSAFPLAMSHTIRAPSAYPDANRLPSGLQATSLTPTVCPFSVAAGFPFAGLPRM